MLRIVLVLAACAMAETTPPDTLAHQDTAATQPVPRALQAHQTPQRQWRGVDSRNESAPTAPAVAETKPEKSQSDYLRLAGYHWLTSLCFAAGGTAWGYFSDWESGSHAIVVSGLYAASFGFQVAVPFDLIYAGNGK